MRIGLFPGQGVDTKSILGCLSQRDATVVHASEILGFDLYEKVQETTRGSSVLDTSVAQPALFVASIVNWKSSVQQGFRFDGYLGHSLGEYAALVAGRSIEFEHALCAVQVRATVMAAAARQAPGGMVAVLGVDLETVERLAAEEGIDVANDNAPGQVVLAGGEEPLAAAAAKIRALGGRSIRLKVSGPFHTAAMAPAILPLSRVLQHMWLLPPAVTVVSNVTARPYESGEQIRSLLVRQLCERVRFRDCIEYFHERGAVAFDDLGPGRVVTGLVERILAEANRRVTVDG